MDTHKTSPLDHAKSSHLAAKAPDSLDIKVLASIRTSRTTPALSWRPALGIAFVLVLLVAGGALFIQTRTEKKDRRERATNGAAHTPSSMAHSVASQKTTRPPGHQVKNNRPPVAIPNLHRPAPVRSVPSVLVWAGKTPARLPKAAGSVRINSMVTAQILSENAVLRRDANGEFSLLEGSARFVVTPLPKGEKFVVRAGGAMVEVLGTIFSVTITRQKLMVSLDRGSIRFTSPTGEKKIMSPGDRVSHLFTSPAPLPSAKQIRHHLALLRDKGLHKEAVRYIRRQLRSHKSGTLRQSLLFDLASIKGEHLHDFAGACKTLKHLRKQYKSGRYTQMATLLWTKYRCN